MPEIVFNVVAENPKIEHVSGNVHEAAMHEHRADQREINRTGTGGLKHFAGTQSAGCHQVDSMSDFVGDHGIACDEGGASRDLEQKDDYVYGDQEIDDIGSRYSVAVIVANRDKHKYVIRARSTAAPLEFVAQDLKIFFAWRTNNVEGAAALLDQHAITRGQRQSGLTIRGQPDLLIVRLGLERYFGRVR